MLHGAEFLTAATSHDPVDELPFEIGQDRRQSWSRGAVSDRPQAVADEDTGVFGRLLIVSIDGAGLSQFRKSGAEGDGTVLSGASGRLDESGR